MTKSVVNVVAKRVTLINALMSNRFPLSRFAISWQVGAPKTLFRDRVGFLESIAAVRLLSKTVTRGTGRAVGAGLWTGRLPLGRYDRMPL